LFVVHTSCFPEFSGEAYRIPIYIILVKDNQLRWNKNILLLTRTDAMETGAEDNIALVLTIKRINRTDFDTATKATRTAEDDRGFLSES
jgi:hypothetical protein